MTDATEDARRPPAASGADASSGGVPDAGPLRNTVLQLATQAAGVVFTGALTLYLVRALGPSGYGLYALAISIGGLLVLPAGLGLPMAVGRFLAEYREDVDQVRAILALGMWVQVPVAVVVSLGMFAAAGPIADAYGHPGLGWPLRWAALAVGGQTVFSFLTSVGTSVRQSRIGLAMAVTESVTETVASASLVLLGAGAAGAVLGRTVGYAVGAGAGVYLVSRVLGGARAARRTRRRVGRRTLMSYAGVMFVVDLSFNALSQLDVLVIGALLSAAAVGTFSAMWRIIVVLGYLGVAVAGGVAPRLSKGGGLSDTRAFSQGIRWLLIVQGLLIAPMVVWDRPIVQLLLGSGYRGSADVLRVLSVVAFVSPPAALISASVTYLGEARRRIFVVLGTLVLGFVCIYVLVRAIGLIGAAIGDGIIVLVYVAGHLWICCRLIHVDLRRLMLSCIRTLISAAVTTLPLLALGVDHLSPLQWVVGLLASGIAYTAVLVITRELSLDELRAVRGAIRSALPGL